MKRDLIADIFVWSDGFEVGLDEVDAQHRKLVGILNQLARNHAGHVAAADLLRVFDELVNYTADHFGTEEALMAVAGVSPEHSAAHRHAHRQFVEQALAARKEAERAPREVTGPTLAFLTKWLIQHILGMDRRLGEEVRKAQEKAGVPVTVAAPPSGERTTAVLLEAIDGLYLRLGQNADELLASNRRLQQEVAERRAANQRLRKLERAVENSPVSIFVTDRDGVIEYANPKCSEITGYANAEVVGQNPRLFRSGSTPMEVYRQLWSTVLSGEEWNGELLNRKKNGEFFWERASISAVTDESGVITNFVAIKLDITRNKQAEIELHDLHRDFVSFLENTSDFIYFKDRDSRFRFCSQTLAAITGHASWRDMIGKHDREVFPKDMAQIYCEEELPVFRDGVPLLNKIDPYYDGQGRRSWVSTNKWPLFDDEEKDVVGIFGVSRDITASIQAEEALRESEARFRQMFERNDAVMLLIEPGSGSIVDANAAAGKFYGYPVERMKTMGIEQINALSPTEVAAERDTALRQKRNYFVFPHRLASGEVRTVEVHSSPLEVGKRALLFSIVHDITGRMRAEAAWRESEKRFRSLVENSPLCIHEIDLAGRISSMNRAGLLMMGVSEESQVRGLSYLDAVSTDDQERIGALLAKAYAGETNHFEFKASGAGEQIFKSCFVPIKSENGDVSRLMGITENITERKLAESYLLIAATAFEAQEGMVVTDAGSVIQRVNRAFTEITGYTAEEAVGRTSSLLKSGHHDAAFYAEMWASIRGTGTWQGEIWNRRKNGEVYPEWLTISAVKGDAGAVTHYVATMTDITRRKETEEEIKQLAFFDPLTLLPNRRLLLDRLQRALVASTRTLRQGALLFIDLDNFKILNDTLGHDKGDMLLELVAKRLTTCIREGDTVARLGGDEFVVVLDDLSEAPKEAAAQTRIVGEKILATLNQTYLLAGLEYHSTPSIGATLFGDHKETVEDLLKQGDLAMYQAKAAGRNTLRFFDPEMQAMVTTRAELESELRRAVQAKQFLLYYQPQVDGEGRLSGAEALIRWRHPLRDIVSPLEFIPLAEETGLIFPLGHWVLETACTQLAAWANQPAMTHLTLAVNVSAHQFRQPDFVDQVLSVLNNTGANPQRLKLELTESLLVDNMKAIIEKMSALKAKGVGFSLDDFGTGYSSLSYLKRLPLDQLKIDQSFVRDVLVDPNDASIAKTVIALAQNLGLDVIAEGVETAEQRDFLASAGCHAYQGYFFSRPLPIESFEEFVQRV